MRPGSPREAARPPTRPLIASTASFCLACSGRSGASLTNQTPVVESDRQRACRPSWDWSVALLLAAYWVLGGGVSGIARPEESGSGGRLFMNAPMPCPRSGREWWVQFGVCRLAGLVPVGGRFPARPGCVPPSVSTSSTSLRARQIWQQSAQRPPFVAARSHASGGSGIFANGPAPQPAAGAAFDYVRKRPAAAASSETRVGAAPNALPMPLLPDVTITASPGLPDRRAL